jgi:hypothetical protein
MKGNDIYDVKETKESLHMIRKKYKQTKLDDSFQRRGGMERGSGWTKKAAEEYMESVFGGAVFNKIMTAEVEPCHRYAIDNRDDESEKYFKNLLNEGYEYVSIDGNNTSSTFNAYLDSQFPVYTDLDPATRGRGKKKKYFKDLSETEQEDLLYTEKLTYYTFRKIGIVEMCSLFRRENTSTHLNKQEYRQARWSDMSKFIRDIANEKQNRDFFKNIMVFSESDMDKRKHEEALAQLVYKIEDKYSLDCAATQLDAFYEKTPQLSKSTISLVKSVMKDVSLIAKEVKLIKRHKLGLGATQALFDLIAYINSQKKEIKIDNHEQFMNWFLETDETCRQISLKISEEEKFEKSYIYWTRVYTHKSSFLKSRNLFSRALTIDLVKLLEDGALASVRTGADVFSTSQRLRLFYLQDRKLRNGQEISILDLYTGELEADHVVSVKDGGTTTIENGELMTAHENRQKGSTSNQPHFDHQREL